jgi:hypothetical protein
MGREIQKQLERLGSQERGKGSSVRKRLRWKRYKKLQTIDGTFHRFELHRRQACRL